jgi:hypothetical protein
MSVRFTYSAPILLLTGSRAADLSLDGEVKMGSNKIRDMAEPTLPTDAATAKYVTDSITTATSGFVGGGGGTLLPVRLATSGALPTYISTTTTLTGAVNGELNVDGVLVALSDRILVKDGASVVHNGIYTVTDVGSVSSPYILTRASDYAAKSTLFVGLIIVIGEGTSLALSIWFSTTPSTNVPGTDAITFTPYSPLSNGIPLPSLKTTSVTYSEADDLNAINALYPSVKFRGAINWTMTLPAGTDDGILMMRSVSDDPSVVTTVVPDPSVFVLDSNGNHATSLTFQKGQSLTMCYDSGTTSWTSISGGCNMTI